MRGISIHAPRAGCDHSTAAPRDSATNHFNPRTPCGVRHNALDHVRVNLRISIHAPRAGCDGTLTAYRLTLGSGFQSTHPVRGATNSQSSSVRCRANFNPRTPCGVRRGSCPHLRRGLNFNPRTPCGVRRCPARSQPCRLYFNPRTPCGVRPIAASAFVRGFVNFNPRTPCGVRRQTCTTWFAPIFATLPNQMYVCLHYTCFTTLFQPKTWFSAVFQRCEAPRISMFASASHRVKASAIPPAHRSAWRRHARHDFDNCCRDCRSANCPFPGQSAPPSDA